MVLALVALAGACDRGAEPTGPPPQRILVEPDFGLLKKRDPEADRPPWRHYGSMVLSDERDGHVLQPKVELVLPLPEGESACETALAASMSREDAAGRTVRIELDVEEHGARRRVLEKELELSALREGWSALSADFGAPLRSGSKLVARAVPTGTVPWPPAARLFLAQPQRQGRLDGRANLLVISIDTLRADHMTSCGYARDTTPRIDALAARGVLFESAYATAPWTLPSYGSLFTSRSPTVHRAGINPVRAATFEADGDARDADAIESLAPDLPVLAQILRDKGWATLGLHSNPYLEGKSGVQRGFQTWIQYRWCADTAVDMTLDWIERRKGAPWFAFVHVFDPHQPYTPPPPWDRKYADRVPEEVPGYPPRVDAVRARTVDESLRKFMVDEYDGEIAWTDSQVGRLIDALEKSGDLANTLVVLQSDHGEEFWEHGGYEHGHTQHEELLHVAFVLAFDGRVPKQKRVKERVSMLDVMPTVLELLDVEGPSAVEGLSLVPTWEGRALPERDLVTECLLYGAREAKAIYSGNEKLIVRGGEAPQLFDLAQDPREEHDLAAERPKRAAELRAKLERRARTLAAQAHTSAVREFSAREQEALHSVGYGKGADVDPGGKR